MFVCCGCCALSGRGLCDGLITCPEESYRMWRVVCVISKNLVNEEAIAPVGLQGHKKMIWYCNDMNNLQALQPVCALDTLMVTTVSSVHYVFQLSWATVRQ
jgi:hypothetical protein